MTGGDLTSRMWLELSVLAKDRWPAIRRAVAAGIATDLLARAGPPTFAGQPAASGTAAEGQPVLPPGGGLKMTGQGETLRQKASWLMNDYEALGPRPGGESAYAETMMAYQQHAQCPPASPAAGDFICPTVR